MARFLFPTRYLRPGLMILLAFIVTSCSLNPFANSGGDQIQTPSALPTFPAGTLPGQEIWKDGTSSFVFGTNDTYEWSQKNIQNQPAIQKALKSAGFTLIRSFFPDNASDAVIEQRIRTIENSGARCLGVITNTTNTKFNEHLVSYLGKRCQMYEFGNEPDTGDNKIQVEDYLACWNAQIPQLRKINPNAVFIGPTSYTYHFDGPNDYMRSFLEGTKSSKVLPDAISFHFYPCFEESRESCLGKTGQYKQAVEGMRGLVKAVLGKELPVGVTEWNYDPGNPPPAYGDEKDFITKFSTEALTGLIQGGAAFACQFDAASYSGYGRLDMFNVENNQPKPQYDAIKAMIAQYHVASNSTGPPHLSNWSRAARW
jgi:hypothetical protein